MPTQWLHISTVIIFSGCASIMRRSLRFTTDSTQTDTNSVARLYGLIRIILPAARTLRPIS